MSRDSRDRRRVAVTALAAAVVVLALVALVPGASASQSGSDQAVAARAGEVVFDGVVKGSGWRFSVPLVGATVTVQGTTSSAMTVAQGVYTIVADLAIPPYGAFVLRASKGSQYVARSKSVAVSAVGQTVTTSFSLTIKGTRVRGVVKSWKGKRLSGVRVSCAGKARYTGRRGTFVLKSLRLKPGTRYTLRLSKAGYFPKRVKFTSRPGGTRNKGLIRLAAR